MKLDELYPNMPATEITGIQLDSRKVKEGNIFFAIRGTESDGHWFIPDAIEKKAAAVIYSDNLVEGVAESAGETALIHSEDVRAELGRVADRFYGSPSKELTMFGVTGTNGKTTTSSIIEWLAAEYKPCGYMGTIGIRFKDLDLLPSLTTPDTIEVHKHLASMESRGAKAVAMEVSSHGLSMRRVEKVDFDYAIFTNLTYEHLDYHGTMRNYFEAKQLLFKGMKRDGVAILNQDDEASIEELKKCCNCRYVTYGIHKDADYKASNIQLGHHSTTFTLEHAGRKYTVYTNLVAEYNIYNLLAAMAALHEDGMEMVKIIDRADSIPQVDGRMEVISEGQDFSVIVDYAHTPDGFEKIFQYAEALTKGGGKIYTTFGCPGKRDIAKRWIMGEIAGNHVDEIILTTEDPRDSDPAEIAKEIAKGIDKTDCPYHYVEDRAEAIRELIGMAKTGDVVLILGKGDEPYMYVGDGREDWPGDNVLAKEVLKEML